MLFAAKALLQRTCSRGVKNVTRMEVGGYFTEVMSYFIEILQKMLYSPVFPDVPFLVG
jgi:hypothetical protein